MMQDAAASAISQRLLPSNCVAAWAIAEEYQLQVHPFYMSPGCFTPHQLKRVEFGVAHSLEEQFKPVEFGVAHSMEKQSEWIREGRAKWYGGGR